MLRHLSILLLATVLLFSCEKKDTSINTNTITNPTWQMKPWDTITIPIALNEKENLTIKHAYTEGLPYEGFKGSVTKVLDNTTSKREIHIRSTNARPGTHNAKVVTVYGGDLNDKFDIQQFKITVIPFTKDECQDQFYSFLSKGHRYEGNLPIPESRYHKFVKQGHQLFLHNISVSYWSTNPNIPIESRITRSGKNELVNIFFDCELDKIIIPKQTVLDNRGISYTINGEGTIDYVRNKFKIKYTSNSDAFEITGGLTLF